MKQRIILITALGICLSACSGPRRAGPPGPDQQVERLLYGPWNCYSVDEQGIPDNLLGNYEQGFELREQGVYSPRYFDILSSSYATRNNLMGFWGIRDERFIYFTDRPDERETPDLIWEILQLADQELWLKDQRGRTVKMRREAW